MRWSKNDMYSIGMKSVWAMEFTVTIKGYDASVSVEMGRSILDSGVEQGAPFPYSCRSGNCGTCKCRLVSGEVEMSPYSEFALTEAEKEQGLILACRAVPWEDCEIELLEDEDIVVHPMRDLVCTLTAVSELTHDIREVRMTIKSGGPFTFSPGQYASVRFGDLPARDFSMACQPDDEELVFYIRIVEDGRVSRHIAETLSAGDRVRVNGPHGSAYLREGRQTPILAIAGGSGLSPIRSIVDRAVALGWEQPIHIYFGVRDERDLYCVEHFQALAEQHPNLHFTPVLSEPSGESTRRTGLVTDAVKADFDSLEGFTAYLAGPPPMVEAAQAMLPELGIPAQAIHADAFYTQAELEAEAAQ